MSAKRISTEGIYDETDLARRRRSTDSVVLGMPAPAIASAVRPTALRSATLYRTAVRGANVRGAICARNSPTGAGRAGSAESADRLRRAERAGDQFRCARFGCGRFRCARLRCGRLRCAQPRRSACGDAACSATGARRHGIAKPGAAIRQQYAVRGARVRNALAAHAPALSLAHFQRPCCGATVGKGRDFHELRRCPRAREISDRAITISCRWASRSAYILYVAALDGVG